MPSFRPNIAAILEDPDGRILIAERIGKPGAWQFPQGGIDEGEDLLVALRRELREELGVAPERYRPIRSRTGYRYVFPAEHRRLGIWDGQEQTYFLCRFLGTDADFDLEQPHPEFSAFRWIRPEEFLLDWLPGFKRDVYRQVLRDFFSVTAD
jgi:putative (di)nucleoside polyphosphate hydrolase